MTYDTMHMNEFRDLPYRESWDIDIEDVGSIIVVPAEVGLGSILKYKLRLFLSRCGFRRPEIYDIDGMHDSGFRLMEVVCVLKGGEMIRAAGGSDVLHLGGICSDSWSIDCLPTSGALRIFKRKPLRVGSALSSLEVFDQ